MCLFHWNALVLRQPRIEDRNGEINRIRRCINSNIYVLALKYLFAHLRANTCNTQ